MFFSNNLMIKKNIKMFIGEKQYKKRITLNQPSIFQLVNSGLIISSLS